MTVQHRRTVPAFLALVAGALLTFLSAAPAAGHATLLGTDPADGEVLTEAPDVVVLTFNESVQTQPDAVRLLDADGQPLPSEAASVDQTVEIAVPDELAEGTYIVDWRVVSADGHPVAGAFTFAVGQHSDVVTQVPDESPSALVDVLHGASQILVYLGLLGATGLTLFTRVLLASGARETVQPRLRRLALVLGGVACVGLLVLIAADGAWRTGAGPAGLVDPGLLGDTLTSATGLSAGMALAGLTLALGPAPGRPRAGGTGRAVASYAGMALALGSLAVTGHTRTYGPAWLVVGSDLLHVLAGSVWLGGILGLLLTLRSRQVPAGAAARTVTRFSSLAAWVVLALGVSGVLLAWRILPTFGALIGTDYGLTLLTKVAVVACIVALAAWNRFRLVPQVARVAEETRARTRLRRSVGVEAGLLVVVLGLTGILVPQSPEPEAEAAAPAQPVMHHTELGEGMLDVHVSPASTGHNTIELTLSDADGAPLEPEADPQLRLSLPEAEVGPLEPAVSRTGPGGYQADVHLPLPGAWELEVSARTSTYESPVVVLPLEVVP